MKLGTVFRIAAGGLAVAAGLALATPAQAGRDGWRPVPHERGGHEGREHHWRPDYHPDYHPDYRPDYRPYPYYIYVPPVYYLPLPYGGYGG